VVQRSFRAPALLLVAAEMTLAYHPHYVINCSILMIDSRRVALHWFFSVFVCLWLALPFQRAVAAEAIVTWDFTVVPTVVNITAGDSVKWMGAMTTHPIAEANATYTGAGLALSSGGSSYTRVFSTPGTYYFVCKNHPAMRTQVNVANAVCNPPIVTAVLDIDGNGTVEPLTDGLLVLRYMLGLRDVALVNGAVGNCPGRTTAGIEMYLANRVVP
jgi:hypothetical protein